MRDAFLGCLYCTQCAQLGHIGRHIILIGEKHVVWLKTGTVCRDNFFRCCLYTVNLLGDEKLTQAKESRSPCQRSGKWMGLWDTLVYFGIKKNSERFETMRHTDCWMSDKINLVGDEEHSQNLELIILWGSEDTITTCNSVSNHEVGYAHHFLLYVFSFCELWLESIALCLLSESLPLLAISSAAVFGSWIMRWKMPPSLFGDFSLLGFCRT